jgi:aspartate/methionine/tyrosine aminotransferase
MTITSRTLPRRMQAVQGAIIPIVSELAARTPGTISLGQGIVAFPPPPQVFESLREISEDLDYHQYGSADGLGPFLERIERKLASENSIPIGPANRVMVTAGSNMAFLHAVLAITDPGDEIILLAPYYFNHDMAVGMASCRTVAVPVGPAQGFRPDLAAIERAITDKTRAVVTISPNNPCGAIYSESLLRNINTLCRDRGLYHISDEVYEYFTYGDARHFSPGCIPMSEGHTISLFSLSKAYGLASWRIGYMVYPEPLAVSMTKIQDTMLVCPPIVSQVAAAAAMDAGRAYCTQHLSALDLVRQRVVQALGEVSDVVTMAPAEGAFYVFLHVATRLDSMALVERLITEHRVAAIPGVAFGVKEGCSIRIAYGALDAETVVEGMGRLVRGIRAIVRRN